MNDKPERIPIRVVDLPEYGVFYAESQEYSIVLVVTKKKDNTRLHWFVATDTKTVENHLKEEGYDILSMDLVVNMVAEFLPEPTTKTTLALYH